MEQRKASVIGYYGSHNSGDEAFRDAFRAILPDVDFTFYGRRVTAEEVAGTRVILGAGDAINEYFLDFLPPDVSFDIIGAALPFLAQSVKLLLPLKQRIGHCYLRHRADVDVAREAGLDASYTPDIVFAIDPAETIPDIGFKRRYGKVVAIFLSDHTTRQGSMIHTNYFYTEFMKYELARALDFIGQYNDILFIPLSWSDWEPDYRMSQDVFVRANERSKLNMHIVNRELSPREIVALMANVSTAISMKFHGIVYSMLAGVPCINIARTKKSHTLMSELGLADLDTPNFSFEQSRCIQMIKRAESGETRQRIRQITSQQRLDLKRVGETLSQSWAKPAAPAQHDQRRLAGAAA